MGGGVGFRVARAAPERLLSLLVGGAGPFGSAPNEAGAALLRRGMEAFVASMEAAIGPLPPRERAIFFPNDPEALAAAMLVATASMEADLGRMALPTLVYCGDQDPAFANAQRAATLLPQGTFVALPGLDYWRAVARAEVVLPHLRAFLERVAAAPGAPV